MLILLFTNSYRRIERGIIAFVSVIGLSFLYELFLVDVDWGLAARSWVTPSIPQGSMLIIMSVLGAVVMPHNKYTPKWIARPILGSAVLASISTSLAEILGGAIALEMLFDIPIIVTGKHGICADIAFH